jgi:hypothetical protein
MEDRERRLLALISKATGHQIVKAGATAEEGEDLAEEDMDLAAADNQMEAA